MLRTSVVFLFLGVATIQAAKLPSFFSKCKKGDPEFNDCILNNLKKGYDDFKKGDNSYHIQSLTPLKVPKLYIDVNGGLTIDLEDVILTGFEAAVFTKATMDLDKKVIYLELHAPKLICEAHYDINGRILILPIQGNGPLNVTFVEPKVKYTLNYEIQKKGDKELIVPTKNTFVYTITRAYFELHNLFNGDKRLGEEMSKFLNENWKEVNEEIGEKLGEAIGEVLQLVLANFFKKVPYNELIAL